MGLTGGARAAATTTIRLVAALVGALWLVASLRTAVPEVILSVDRAARDQSPQAAELAAGTPPAGAFVAVAARVPARASVSVVQAEPADGYSYYWVSYWLAPRPVTFDALPPAASYVLVIREGVEPPGNLGSRRRTAIQRSGPSWLAMYAPSGR